MCLDVQNNKYILYISEKSEIAENQARYRKILFPNFPRIHIQIAEVVISPNSLASTYFPF